MSPMGDGRTLWMEECGWVTRLGWSEAGLDFYHHQRLSQSFQLVGHRVNRGLE
jgi:hypothetical protein